jgi:hypothetical protein
MRLWWKDLDHSFFYKRMAHLTNCIFFSQINSLKTLLDLQLSLLSLSVQAKRRILFLLFGVSRVTASGVENREESFRFGKLFLSFAWFWSLLFKQSKWRNLLLLLHEHMYISFTNYFLDLYLSDCIKEERRISLSLSLSLSLVLIKVRISKILSMLSLNL